VIRYPHLDDSDLSPPAALCGRKQSLVSEKRNRNEPRPLPARLAGAQVRCRPHGDLFTCRTRRQGPQRFSSSVLFLADKTPSPAWRAGRGRDASYVRPCSRLLFLFGALLIPSLWATPAGADWPTARGNPQRTGNIDGQPGPKAPAVLWSYKAQEHYVASPVPAGSAIFVGGVGTYNTGVFHAVATTAQAPERVLWSKTAPFLTRPTVCAPAVIEGLAVFGDGMHQTDDATLYCLQAETGLPAWQFAVPGRLVHLESAPTIDRGRVYIGGGDAGVLCLDLKRVLLDGREQDVSAVLPAAAKRWAELTAQYEDEKRKNALLAIPPSEDALPKATGKLLWQQKSQLHVDAPLAVAGDLVWAASAYLDDEQVGRRALVCLRAGDGSIVWQTPLEVNPWAGPTLADGLVLIGCSSIRFDRKLLGQARGEVVALDAATGQVRWRLNAGGGVLSPVAVRGGLAVFTSTSGHVIACQVANGERRWAYDAGKPFFAGPAVAGDMVYAADLRAVVHALNLTDGRPLWKLDVAADPSVQSRSFVFGSPIVHGGELFLATCNLDGDADQPAAVVCLSDKRSGAPAALATISVDQQQRTVSIPCKVAPRKLPTLKDVYPLEVVATYPAPRGQKAHETVVTIEAKPSEVHQALESLGLKPGKPARGEGAVASGPEVRLYLEVPGITRKPWLVPVEKLLVDLRTGKTMPSLKWRFTGSALRQPDPEKPDKVYGADLSGTLIALVPVTDETVVQTELTMAEERLIRLDTNKNLLPPEGTDVRLIIEVK
jgi:outer membrane protein assembly factor BamB